MNIGTPREIFDDLGRDLQAVLHRYGVDTTEQRTLTVAYEHPGGAVATGSIVLGRWSLDVTTNAPQPAGGAS